MKSFWVAMALVSLTGFGAEAQTTPQASEATKVVMPSDSLATASTTTTSASVASELSTSVSTPSDKGIIGLIEMCPSIATNYGDHSYRMENSVELGYKLNAQTHLLYHQDFWTNLSNSSSQLGGSDGLGLVARDGYLDVFSDHLLESSDHSLFLTYEGRAYLPTMAFRRDAGLITFVRNYFMLGKKVNDALTVYLMEVPIPQLYSQASHNGAANPGYENRVYVEADYSFSSKVILYFPIAWSATKYRTDAGATGSGTWGHFVFINPELDYNINSTYTVGAAYYNNTSFMTSDLSSFQIGEGFKDSVAQFVFKANL